MPKLKNIGIVALMFSPILVSCEEGKNFASESIHQGTNIGLQECVDKNADAGLSGDTVRKLCTNKHAKRISGTVDVTAGYEDHYGLGFIGHLFNESKDEIITSFDVYINHEDNKDSAGKVRRETYKIENIFLEPGEYHKIEIYHFKFRPDKNRISSEYFTWSLGNFKGLDVRLK